MNHITGAAIGALCGLFLLAAVGGLWGGIVGASPCHRAPDFLTGAFWGALLVTHQYGLAAALGGGFAGGVASSTADREWSVDPYLSHATAIGVGGSRGRVWKIQNCGERHWIWEIELATAILNFPHPTPTLRVPTQGSS